MVVEIATIFAFLPSTVSTSENTGILLKLNPPEISFTFAIPLFKAVSDLVLYSIRSV